MFSREGRVRVFLAFLILVLVLVNAQSLQVSHQTRALTSELFEGRAKELALRIASSISAVDHKDVSRLTELVSRLAEERGLRSACVFDWDGHLVTGGACAPAEAGALDRLDADGRQRLVESGWIMTPVAPRYDVERAAAFGYLALPVSATSGPSPGVLRIEVPAGPLAAANRRFRATIVYQVSALSLVLLAVILFLNSLLAPQRKLVAEARTVATELAGPEAENPDEGEFLLSTFQEVVARLREKERELKALHQLEKARADETEALASDIIHSMTTGLVSLDPSGLVVLVNPAAERMFGIDPAASRDRPFAEVFPGSPELETHTSEALEHGTYHLRGQTVYEKSTGETLHLGTSVIPLRSPDGSAKGALCLFADLTEVVELRERLFLKENLARLGEMVAGIAHEFRNGLGTIMGNAKLLKDHTEGEASEIVDALLEESQALARVVTEFLQFARPDPRQLETVDVSKLVSELVSELEPRASAAGVVLRLEVRDGVRLEGDERLLRKAVQNLIVNAIESVAGSENGGGVHVEVEVSDPFALVRIRDDGPGVSASERGRIFTPFFTGKPDGTGLGLSVVQKIAVSHNGSVELEDSASGASFVLRLPLRAVGARAEEWV